MPDEAPQRANPADLEVSLLGLGRSRRRPPREAVCYLCGQPIGAAQAWDREHLPPKRVFARSIRQTYSPRLWWLYSHVSCNAAYRDDEACFVVSFAGHVETPAARAVVEDIRRAANRGFELRLIRDVLARFGAVEGPNGERLFAYDAPRVQRFIRKIVCGLYFLHLGRFLAPQRISVAEILDPRDMPREMTRHAWFPLVRDTLALGRYGAVFDYKWICLRDPERGAARLNALALCFWDGLIAVALFHDPSCPCGDCPSSASTVSG
jgi:hypothetical protein